MTLRVLTYDLKLGIPSLALATGKCKTELPGFLNSADTAHSVSMGAFATHTIVGGTFIEASFLRRLFTVFHTPNILFFNHCFSNAACILFAAFENLSVPLIESFPPIAATLIATKALSVPRSHAYTSPYCSSVVSFPKYS